MTDTRVLVHVVVGFTGRGAGTSLQIRFEGVQAGTGLVEGFAGAGTGVPYPFAGIARGCRKQRFCIAGDGPEIIHELVYGGVGHGPSLRICRRRHSRAGRVREASSGPGHQASARKATGTTG